MRANENLVLSGNKIRLVPYTSAHVPRYHLWMQDPLLQEMTASEPLSLEEEYTMQSSWQADQDKCTFIIELKEQFSMDDDRMIGDVNLFFNDEDPSVAEIEVMIAEKRYWRQGLGREALYLMLAYGTQELRVSRFTAKIALKNEASLRLFEALGFQWVCTSDIFQEAELRLTVNEESVFRNLNLKPGKYI